mmetsp:Transcript_30879/g.100509  ORF Transcript_30879/g.100509 Transcript_30879/m.100509 type:complete len:218 (-) Transcript_30879:2361-3014(-)
MPESLLANHHRDGSHHRPPGLSAKTVAGAWTPIVVRSTWCRHGLIQDVALQPCSTPVCSIDVMFEAMCSHNQLVTLGMRVQNCVCKICHHETTKGYDAGVECHAHGEHHIHQSENRNSRCAECSFERSACEHALCSHLRHKLCKAGTHFVQNPTRNHLKIADIDERIDTKFRVRRVTQLESFTKDSMEHHNNGGFLERPQPDANTGASVDGCVEEIP